MIEDLLAEFYVHTVGVETFLGSGAYGDVFAAPVVLAPPSGCFMDGARKYVRSSTGAQVVSESTLSTAPANAALFTAGSRVTFNGVVSTVIKSNPLTSGDLDLPDHVEVALT